MGAFSSGSPLPVTTECPQQPDSSHVPPQAAHTGQRTTYFTRTTVSTHKYPHMPTGGAAMSRAQKASRGATGAKNYHK